MPEFRKDPITGRWVIIASERAARPQRQIIASESNKTGPCPFCAGNEAMTPPAVMAYYGDQNSINGPGWTVRVVPNKYPALVREGRWLRHSEGMYEARDGLGAHEVIIESPKHVVSMGELSENEIKDILRAHRDRMLELQKDDRWRYILVYKNQGLYAGATLDHIHSQLIALPIVPKEVFEEVQGAKAYFDSARRCIYCDMIQQEADHRGRIVTENKSFVAFCPYASRFPYEIWLLPKSHLPFFEQGSDEEYAELSQCLKDVLIRLNRQLNNPPFNYIIHSSPLDGTAAGYYHWHCEIMPKLTQAAGFEWGSGSTINPVAPEYAARHLRDISL